MQERIPALVFTIRHGLYGLLQDGGAALLPWLRRYAAPGPVPAVPPWMLGLLSVQGTVQAIVDVGAVLGCAPFQPTDDARLIFIEHGELRAGLAVDSAAGIRYVDGVSYAGHNTAEPLVAGAANLNGQRLRLLDGVVLLDRLAEALGSPLAGRV